MNFNRKNAVNVKEILRFVSFLHQNGENVTENGEIRIEMVSFCCPLSDILILLSSYLM